MPDRSIREERQLVAALAERQEKRQQRGTHEQPVTDRNRHRHRARDGATGHRRILDEYSPYLLDQMIAVVTASTVIAYTVYATSPDTAANLGTARLGLTIPFVLYGIFRYLYLVHQKRGGGSPAALLLTDRPLLACVALWAVAVTILLYSPLGRY